MKTQLTSQEINVIEERYKQKHFYEIILKTTLRCHVCYLNMNNHDHIPDHPDRHYNPITRGQFLPCTLVLESWVSTDRCESWKAGSSRAWGRAPQEAPREELQGCSKRWPSASSSLPCRTHRSWAQQDACWILGWTLSLLLLGSSRHRTPFWAAHPCLWEGKQLSEGLLCARDNTLSCSYQLLFPNPR